MDALAVAFPNWVWLRNPRTPGEVLDYLTQHVQLTVLSILIGLVIAVPLAIVAVRYRRLYTPLLTITGVLFTIPSLALFVLLLAFAGTGLSIATSLIGLVIYNLLILFRNTAVGLDSVDPEVREAAEAMGHTRRQQLWRVELPAALPVIIAGVRVATVTTIGLVTITALIGQGGLGRLFLTGFTRQDFTILLAGFVLSVLLAVAADLGLLALQRWLTPWSRSRVTV